jgi:hypothetical protein
VVVPVMTILMVAVVVSVRGAVVIIMLIVGVDADGCDEGPHPEETNLDPIQSPHVFLL